MEQLSPAYFSDLARQLAFLSAVLGGFSATFLGTLLAVDSSDRIANLAIGSSAVSAACFICTALVASFIAAGTHPDAPQSVASASQSIGPRITVVVVLLLGMYALLLSLGLSGWVRSRAVGIVTSVTAAVAAVVATWAVTGF